MVLRNGECGMKKVLVAVDGSDKSLEAADYAMSIANKEGAQLIILNVLDTEPWFYGQSANGWTTEDELRKVYADEIMEREKILAKIKDKAEKINMQSKTEVLMYPQNISTAAAIVNYAEKEKVDLITIGTRGRTGITKMLLGSVARAVVTYAHCPVIVVK
ncbi:MAG TPA: universal stress protein [Candidatus Bathyarchaeia archaeon]|nr:universal stress protein [Candidatus Bathyarchaeia archaeon]